MLLHYAYRDGMWNKIKSVIPYNHLSYYFLRSRINTLATTASVVCFSNCTKEHKWSRLGTLLKPRIHNWSARYQRSGNSPARCKVNDKSRSRWPVPRLDQLVPCSRASPKVMDLQVCLNFHILQETPPWGRHCAQIIKTIQWSRADYISTRNCIMNSCNTLYITVSFTNFQRKCKNYSEKEITWKHLPRRNHLSSAKFFKTWQYFSTKVTMFCIRPVVYLPRHAWEQ